MQNHIDVGIKIACEANGAAMASCHKVQISYFGNELILVLLSSKTIRGRRKAHYTILGQFGWSG